MSGHFNSGTIIAWIIFVITITIISIYLVKSFLVGKDKRTFLLLMIIVIVICLFAMVLTII